MSNSSANPEPATLIGLTSLTTNGRPLVPPKLNRRRALIVLAKIEEILFWERNTERERETRFVELGRYLCEARAGQYWRLDNLRSFDEFLEKKFPESRRKAYYLMAIHEHLCRGSLSPSSRWWGGPRRPNWAAKPQLPRSLTAAGGWRSFASLLGRIFYGGYMYPEALEFRPLSAPEGLA